MHDDAKAYMVKFCAQNSCLIGDAQLWINIYVVGSNLESLNLKSDVFKA